MSTSSKVSFGYTKDVKGEFTNQVFLESQEERILINFMRMESLFSLL